MTASQDRRSVAPLTTYEDVLAVIEPDETISYITLLERLTAPRGLGVLIETFAFRRGVTSEIVFWREPLWDADHEGGWIEGTLYVARKPADVTEA